MLRVNRLLVKVNTFIKYTRSYYAMFYKSDNSRVSIFFFPFRLDSFSEGVWIFCPFPQGRQVLFVFLHAKPVLKGPNLHGVCV